MDDLLGVAALTAAGLAVGAGSRGWVHLVQPFPHGGHDDGRDHLETLDDLSAWLDEVAAEGWQLVAVPPHGEGFVVILRMDVDRYQDLTNPRQTNDQIAEARRQERRRSKADRRGT